jgi:hypothetical protein
MSDLSEEELQIITPAIAIYVMRCLSCDAMPPEMEDKAYAREAISEAGGIELSQDEEICKMVKSLYIFLNQTLIN